MRVERSAVIKSIWNSPLSTYQRQTCRTGRAQGAGSMISASCSALSLTAFR